MRALKKIAFLFTLIPLYGFTNGFRLFYILIFPKNKTARINFIDKAAPVFLRQGTSDIPTFKQIFIEQSYETDLSSQPKYIVDCGANIGLSVRYFRMKYPHAKIIAIEADRSNFAMLKRNTEHDSNIILFHNGIWHKKAFLEVVDVFNVGSWGLSVIEVAEKNEGTIDALSINDIITTTGIPQIDLLKIDIEGSEKELFDNQPQTWLSQVKNLIIETHDKYREGTAKSVLSTLLEYKFNLEVKNDSLIFKDIAQ